MTGAARAALVLSFVGACGGDSTPTPEVVVQDARLAGAAPVVIGASATSVSWTAAPGDGTTLVAAGSLATLPAAGQQLATSLGPVAPAGDFVMFASNHAISSVRIDTDVLLLAKADPEMIAGSNEEVPLLVWTLGAVVEWDLGDVAKTAMLPKIVRCDHARVTPSNIYVAGDTATAQRLLRIDRRTAAVSSVTSPTAWAASFPGGAVDGATYRGRIVGTDDTGVLFLVEETPSKRGIVVWNPVVGDASVVLEHVSGASGFFASTDTLYWQEGDALLSAPRTGGSASIVAPLPGPAGAFADGYVYFVDGNSIERIRVE